MIFNLAEHSSTAIYHLMTQTVIPRPVAWVLTENSDKTFNLAPFSYFVALCSDPALVAISVGKKAPDLDKDTASNMLEKRDQVIHIASVESSGAVTASAAPLPYGESELDKIDEKLVEFEGSPLPRLESCKVAFHCSFYDSHKLGPAEQTIVYSKIESIYVADEAVQIDGNRVIIDPEVIDPLARLGGAKYAGLGRVFEVQRPK